MKRFKVRRVASITQDFYVWADTPDAAHAVADAADLTAGTVHIEAQSVISLIEVPPILTGRRPS